jgi:hypothetical protein
MHKLPESPLLDYIPLMVDELLVQLKAIATLGDGTRIMSDPTTETRRTIV